MLGFLKELFSSNSLLETAFEETQEMLREDYRMFEEAIRSLRHSDSAELKFDIFKADKSINKYERSVRRKVMAHLAVANPGDVSAGLVLISVVSDVERIGDYTKNIAEIAMAHPSRLKCDIYEEKLSEIEELITNRFKSVSEAYINHDEEMATALMLEHNDISSWCDKTVNEMISAPPANLPTGTAVCLTMYIRFLKRISAHLTNIVSSVVNPFPRIGYRAKGSGDSGSTKN